MTWKCALKVADVGLGFCRGWAQGRLGVKVIILGSIVLWAIGISQDYLKGVTECSKSRQYRSWPMSGIRKAHQTNKREIKYLHLPDTPLGSSCLSQCIRNACNLLKVIKAFLADIKRTMGVQAFMLVGYIVKDENPHSTM